MMCTKIILYIKIAFLSLFFSCTLIGQEIIMHEDASFFLKDYKLNPQDVFIQQDYFDPTSSLRHIYFFQKVNDRILTNKLNSIHIHYPEKQIIYQNIDLVARKNFPSTFSSSLADPLSIYLDQNWTTHANYHPSKSIQSNKSNTEYVNLDNPSDKIKIKESWYALDDKIIPIYLIHHISSHVNLLTLIDANSSLIIEQNNRILSCDYNAIHNHEHTRFTLSPTNFLANTYHAFAAPTESPSHGSRSMITQPWLANPNASPLGWHHDGFSNYTITKGNNAIVYEDANDDNQPYPGDTSYAKGGPSLDFNFNYSIDSTVLANRDAGITNAFYWTNILHDVFYNYGFDESAGNFQYNNFNKGGSGGDPVKVETLDNFVDARNNANFGTPPDGVAPTMQVYPWLLPSFDTILITQPNAIISKIAFVPAALGLRIKAPLSGTLAFPYDATSYPTLGCSAYSNASSINGKIAVIDRGICSTISKAYQAENAGAIALIICQNETNKPFVLGGNITSTNIPVVMISKSDCARLRIYKDSSIQATMLPASQKTFSVGLKNYIFSLANFGPEIPKFLSKENIQVIDNAGNIQDACDPIINNINNKIALITAGNCEPSFKIYQAQLAGASAAILCNTTNNYPDTIPTGTYGRLIKIPSISITKKDCDSIKTALPSQGIFRNDLPQLMNGEMDAGLLTHEYGHGISLRLTGGGSISCLTNAEQAGEGWSDFFGLMMTAKISDNAYLNRGIGTFVSGTQIIEQGLRPYPYHVDTLVNPARYSYLKNLPLISQPHGIGYVWCSMLWDLNWALINQFGFETNIYNNNSPRGNVIALKLVLQGLKLQVCNPGFVDARNAILRADTVLYNGVHSCLIWNIFARRGLGFSANQGSAYRRDDGTEAFDLPLACSRISEADLFGLRVLSTDELSMIASPEHDNIKLTWHISQPLDQYPFYIIRKNEKNPEEKIIFKTSTLQNQFLDTDVNNNTDYYYQLVIVRGDEEIKSKWVTARLDDNYTPFNVYPNPVEDILHIDFTRKNNSNYQIRLINSQAYTLDEILVPIGTASAQVNMEGLPQGIYFIQIDDGIKIINKKIIRK